MHATRATRTGYSEWIILCGFGIGAFVLMTKPVLAGDGATVGPAECGPFIACLGGPGVPAVPACVGSDLDFDADVDMTDFGLFQERFHIPTIPRLLNYGDGGCLPGEEEPAGGEDPLGGGDEYPFCGDDVVDVLPGPGAVQVVHRHTTYNCCPDEIMVTLEVDGTFLRLTEEEILTMPCPCLCCYDVDSTVVDVEPGIYTVEYCWFDYETSQDVCHVEDVEIPRGGTARSDLPRDEDPNVDPAELAELAAGNTAFAFDFYRAIHEEEGNLFYSPLSISMALAMTYAGTRGNTEAQVADVFHFTLGQERLHLAINALDLALESRGEGAQGQDGEGFRLNVVNAIWGQAGYSFLPTFLDVLAENYGAGMRLLNFALAPEPSRLIINDWVSDQTEGRIEDLIPAGLITGMTRLVLTNAVYFNAAWDMPFPEDATADGTFHRLDGTEVNASMMTKPQELGYVVTEDYFAVELPYDGHELSMVIIVPAAGEFAGFEADLDAATVASIVAALEVTNLELTMPGFRFESRYMLRDVLIDMGMVDAFLPGVADLSGMDGTRRFFISAVVHKGFVAVDEAGTEAAAATAVIIEDTSAPPPPVAVVIDRPFVFFVRDIQTQTVLFVGRVVDPGT